jgi:hypothetical protein
MHLSHTQERGGDEGIGLVFVNGLIYCSAVFSPTQTFVPQQK